MTCILTSRGQTGAVTHLTSTLVKYSPRSLTWPPRCLHVISGHSPDLHVGDMFPAVTYLTTTLVTCYKRSLTWPPHVWHVSIWCSPDLHVSDMLPVVTYLTYTLVTCYQWSLTWPPHWWHVSSGHSPDLHVSDMLPVVTHLTSMLVTCISLNACCCPALRSCLRVFGPIHVPGVQSLRIKDHDTTYSKLNRVGWFYNQGWVICAIVYTHIYSAVVLLILLYSYLSPMRWKL